MTHSTLAKALLLGTTISLAACAPMGGNGGASSSSSSVSSQPYADMIQVSSPAPNAQVSKSQPFVVTGRATGPWYFEASFPVKLLDSNGNILAEAPAQAQGDWMTMNFVPFIATLNFTTMDTSGTLVLRNDNPSGEPVNDKSISIPVTFVP
jgi:hypothetical protein